MHPLKTYWLNLFESETREGPQWLKRKRDLFRKREAEIVRIHGKGHVFQELRLENKTTYQYLLHLSFLIKQDNFFYMEEQAIPYEFDFQNGEILNHRSPSQELDTPLRKPEKPIKYALNRDVPHRFNYDRLAAVQYAERWWNDYNPDFQIFDVDCTNYVSQCLYAGGAPMRGAPDREKGWWYEGDNWSYSWSVSHSLRWYLSGSTEGLQGKEVAEPEELSPGDVICYDFEGDGRFDHSTFVVAKDAKGMPLVNAHTENSRHRYWSYEDSTAWTPNIKYKFFQIGK